MALKANDQTRLDGLNQTAQMLQRMGVDIEQIKVNMAPMITSLEQDTNSKLNLVSENDVLSFSVVDLRSDFVRTRANSDGSMLSLRARVVGIPFEIKVRKTADGLAVSNAQLVESLTLLAEYVRQMPAEMLNVGPADWPRIPGGEPTQISGGASGSGSEADDGGDEPLAAGTTGDAFDEEPVVAQAVEPPLSSAPLSGLVGESMV